jgi:hypothetical protein
MNSGSSAWAIVSRRWLSSCRTSLLCVALLPLSAAPLVAAASLPVNQTLDRVGRRVEMFWQQFPRVACIETVTQFKLDARSKILIQDKSVYDYLIVLGNEGGELTIEEARTQKAKTDKAPSGPLLVTKGFSTLLLIFHPLFQPSFEFEPMPDEQVDGKMLYRIGFRHVPGSPTPSVLQVREMEYPLEWRGVAWIDPDTWAVVKMQAGLMTSMESVGLKSLNSEVLYRPINYAGASETYWLPDTATVEARSLRQHWRNVHRFTAYRKFSVDTKLTVETPE